MGAIKFRNLDIETRIKLVEILKFQVDLYLAKFDNRINLECLESCTIPAEYFDDGLPKSDLALMTLGVLIWKNNIAKCRLLCLVRDYDANCSASLEALKRSVA